MTYSTPINSVFKTYRDPIIYDIIKKLTSAIGGDPDTDVIYKDVFLKRHPFGNREQFFYTIEDASSIGTRHMFSNKVNHEVPILMDKDSEFSIRPSYVSYDFNITFRYQSVSKVEVQSKLRRLIDMLVGRQHFYFKGIGSFGVPENAMKYAYNVAKIKKDVLGIDDTLEHIIYEMSTPRTREATNLNAKSFNLISLEKQGGITLNFTDRADLKLESDEENSIFFFETNMILSMKLPHTVIVEFQPLVCNKFLDPELLPTDTKSEEQLNSMIRKEYVKTLISLNYYDTWTVTNGVIDNGVFKGVYLGDDTLNGYLKDIVPKESIHFTNGYVDSGLLMDADLGINFTGNISDVPESQDVEVNIVDGIVVGGPFDGYDTGLHITTTIITQVINHTVYDGLLAGAVEYPYIGGVKIPDPNDIDGVVVAGGMMDGNQLHEDGNKLISNNDDPETFRTITYVSVIDGTVKTVNNTIKVITGTYTGRIIYVPKLVSGTSSLTRSVFKTNSDRENNITQGTITPIRIPYYDIFKYPKSSNQAQIASILLQMDNTGVALSLKSMGIASLDPAVLDLILKYSKNGELFSENSFPLNVKIFENNKEVPNKDLHLDLDTMQISLVNGIDITKTYRMVLTGMKDLSYLNNYDLRKEIKEDPLIGNVLTTNNSSVGKKYSYHNNHVYPNMRINTVFGLSVYAYLLNKSTLRNMTNNPSNFWIGETHYGDS